MSEVLMVAPLPRGGMRRVGMMMMMTLLVGIGKLSNEDEKN